MSEECPKLSRKWRISGKRFQALDNAKGVYMVVPEFLGTTHVTQKLYALIF